MIATGERVPGIVAGSPAMQEVMGLVARIAEAKSAVLLEGESGTGKDLVAHLLHYHGPRRDGPFIKLHCPSVPEELLESELFGHEKGAFTDARQQKAGKLEMADRGTLYFDQVQDLSLGLQAKLLRVVEEKRFERVGGTMPVEVDVRIVTATNKDLRAAIAAKTFREDLYFRIAAVPITIPPLRERGSDIALLADIGLGLLFFEQAPLRLFDRRHHRRGAACVAINAHAQIDLVGAAILAEHLDDLQERVGRLRGDGFDHVLCFQSSCGQVSSTSTKRVSQALV